MVGLFTSASPPFYKIGTIRRERLRLFSVSV
jgi:hypothetical protein